MLCTPYSTTKNLLLYKFFEAQLLKPKVTDWVSQVKRDLRMIDLRLDFNEMSVITKAKLKVMVKEKVKKNGI